jgi:hypothetical protein
MHTVQRARMNGKRRSRSAPRGSFAKSCGMVGRWLVPVAARIRGTTITTTREHEFDGRRSSRPASSLQHAKSQGKMGQLRKTTATSALHDLREKMTRGRVTGTGTIDESTKDLQNKCEAQDSDHIQVTVCKKRCPAQPCPVLYCLVLYM